MATYTLKVNWAEGGQHNQQQLVRRGLLVVSGTEGAAAGDIPASLFSLRHLSEVGPLVKNDNTLVVVAGVAHDRGSILGRAAGTNGAANIPAGTYHVTVRGD